MKTTDITKIWIEEEKHAPQEASLVTWPKIEEDDVRAVIRVLKEGPLIKGPLAHKLEAAFGRYVGVPFCHAVSSCTHAIHLALRTLGIGPGDEVLVPNLTYCGSVSPIVNTGATPVFVDINENNYNVCVADAAAKRTARTKAIIPVHLHGYPCDIIALREALPGLLIIEDACQAHGAMRDGRCAGTWGDLSCFSLNQVKPLCGGQGGLVLTHDEHISATIRDLASPGRGSTIGLSYEITEVSAAIALTQLSKLDAILDKARANHEAFLNALNPCIRHRAQQCESSVRPTWHKLRLRVGRMALSVYLDALTERRVPYELWPGTLVSERTEYLGYVAHTPIAKAVMASSFVLGNERFPFHAQSTATVVEWATVINEISTNE